MENGLRYIKLIAIALIAFFSTGLALAQNGWKFGEIRRIDELNSSADEFAPVWNPYEKRLYFNSTRNGYSEFFVANFDGTNFSEPRPYDSPVNKKGDNKSYVAFESPDKAYVSAFRLYSNRSYLNIFAARKEKMSFAAPEPVTELALEAFAAHPAISHDGEVLVFSTNARSSEGDLDLAASYRREDGSWGSIDVVTGINSRGDEITPFFATDNELFFASNGMDGSGGFDIFYSIKTAGIWSAPYPATELNSPEDDSDFSIIDGRFAIFASNRTGSQKLDLYLAEILPDEPEIDVESGLDLAVAAQTYSINVVVSGEFSEISPAAFFYARDNFDDLDFKTFIDKEIFASSDELFHASPAIIAARMTRLPSCELTLSISSDDAASLPTANAFVEKARDELGLKKTRFVIEKTNGGPKDMILLSSNCDELFDPVETGVSKPEFSPPVLEISFDARPRTDLKSWSAFVAIGDYSEKIAESSELPATKYFDLANLAENIKENEKLTLKMIAKDLAGAQAEEDFDIELSFTVVTESKEYILNGQKYISRSLFTDPEADNKAYIPAIAEPARRSMETGKRPLIVGSIGARIEAESVKRAFLEYYGVQAILTEDAGSEIVDGTENFGIIRILTEK